MPLTLEFIGKVSGDSMSGEMGIGPMGSFRSPGRGPDPITRGPLRLLVLSSMHKITLLSIAVLASLVGAAIAQTPEPEPAWRAERARLGASGLCRGRSLSHRRTAQTGYLAVYPAKRTIRNLLQRVRAAPGAGRHAADKAVWPSCSRATIDARIAYHAPIRMATRMISQAAPGARATNARAFPEGTEPCDLGAWSEDRDPKGLNVRAEPSVKARVLGTLPPPYRLKMGGSENTPEGGWLTEFRIIGFKDGWFLIEGATPPGKEYEDEKKYPRNAPKPYAGRGWVAASKVGANYANGGTRMGGLFQAPFADAKWTQAQRKLGGTLDTDGGPKRLLACSGIGDWSKARTACAAGGAASAPTR